MSSICGALSAHGVMIFARPQLPPNWGRFLLCVISMTSGFWPQIVSIPQFLPGDIDRILDAQHISAFSREDMNCPVRMKRSVDLVRYLDIGHVLASGEAADFLECDTLQLMSSNERFGHRAVP
jgi:hypothetical protein